MLDFHIDMSYEMLTQPDPRLRIRSSPVPVSDITSTRVQTMIDELMVTMKEEHGVGVAAPQVGIHERIIIVETPKGPEAFINPEIIDRSHRTVNSEEGCLSVPGVWGIVKRNKSVRVQALNRKGEHVELAADGLTAIIFQHEIDHLDGVLFVDRVEKFTSPPLDNRL